MMTDTNGLLPLPSYVTNYYVTMANNSINLFYSITSYINAQVS